MFAARTRTCVGAELLKARFAEVLTAAAGLVGISEDVKANRALHFEVLGRWFHKFTLKACHIHVLAGKAWPRVDSVTTLTIHVIVSVPVQSYTRTCIASHDGFDCEFVEPPPKIFVAECPVCLHILREPCQTSCCGQNFFRTCLDAIIEEKSHTPVISPNTFLTLKTSICSKCCTV